MTELNRDNDDPKLWQVYTLAEAVVQGTITAESAGHLDELLRTDVEARRHYVEFMCDSAAFCRWSRASLQAGEAEGLAGQPKTDDGLPKTDEGQSKTDGGRDARGTNADLAADTPSANCSSPAVPQPSFFISGHYSHFLGSAAISYGIAILLLSAGVLAAWTWGLPYRVPNVANNAPAAAGPERLAMISGAIDCRWADASTAIEPGAAVLAGRRFALASGLLQISYASRVEVILQGPAIYEADSPHGGFLSLGRLTARVEKRPDADSREPTDSGAGHRLPAPDFTIRTPSAVLANQATMTRPGVLGSSEFGVVVDSPDVTRVHVFRGLLTAQLAGGGPSNATPVPLAANRSMLLARPGSRGLTDLRRKLRMSDVLFARRGVVPLDGQREQVAWLKEIGTGSQRTFVAVGNGEDLELPPLTDPTDGATNGQGPPAPEASSAAGSRAGAVYTCRLAFGLGSLDLATAMLRCDYVARNRIVAIRLNGKTFPRPRPTADETGTATLAVGEFLIHGGLHPGYFVPGTNVLEIDVNNSVPFGRPRMLWLRPEVSAIRLSTTDGTAGRPAPEASGGAARH